MKHEYEYDFGNLSVTTNWRSFFDVRLNNKLISEEVGDCRPRPVILGQAWPSDDVLRDLARDAAIDAAEAQSENA